MDKFKIFSIYQKIIKIFNQINNFNQPTFKIHLDKIIVPFFPCLTFPLMSLSLNHIKRI